MNSNKAPVLVTKHLKKTYEQGAKKLDVIKDVSLSIGKGEIVALVGQSGAGKSTLLHCLGLLDQPTSGEIIIKDVDVSNRNDKERTLIRRKIMGFVYQFHYLQPEFTALENVSIPLMISGSAKKQAEDHAKDLLVSMGLEDRMSHRPARLSGGEQQRVSIARALANSPKILLADEPTGNLDEDTSARIFDLLMKAVKERGVSALIATHNQRLAAQMDRVLTLENGYLGA
ncbi:MAG: ABC transporter [Micavibrio sp.]|nr:ABC transporter [Micavibrio sp.]